jgi:hypothetical protein
MHPMHDCSQVKVDRRIRYSFHGLLDVDRASHTERLPLLELKYCQTTTVSTKAIIFLTI